MCPEREPTPSLPYVRTEPQVSGRRQRNGWIALAASLLVLTTTALTEAPKPTPTLATPQPAAVPAPVLARLPATAPMPTPAGMARALDGPLADAGLGGSPHVEVVDALTGRVLLDRLGRVPTIPASTQKLLTAAAALLVLGPRTRLTTRVIVSGQDVYLVGGGDPTLTTAPALYGAYPASTDLNALAAAVTKRLGSSRPILRVIGVGGLYGGPDEAVGWSPSYLAEGDVAPVRSLTVDGAKQTPGLAPGPRTPDPVLSAAEAFQRALTNAGAAAGTATVGTAPSAPQQAATVVASVLSPPVSALIERMLNYSDADVAEGLGRQIALRSGLPATFAGTAAALTRVARRLQLPEVGQIADASGLSRSDALAPATLTSLLRDAAVGDYPVLRTLFAALPIAGFSGTLALRFTADAPAGAGRVRAKTGWLNGASALAGTVTTADGRLLLFAALAPAPVRSAGEAALDQVAATLAACGCR